jgi:hypothetical protein
MEPPQIPAVDAIDMEILMHRDAHFGGNFEVMIEYYEQNGVGVMPDFEIQEIKRLQNLEWDLKENLSKIYLPEPAKEVVSDSQKLYQSLREAYSNSEKDPLPILLSDLILSEELVPIKEIEALVNQKEKAVPPLIHLLSSPSFYEPLYPGYGRTPIFAAKCLGKIQDERAIPPLFEALGQENFFTDEEIIYALRLFGDKAKSFLIQRLIGTPFSKDNEHAAIALSAFPEDPEIAKKALDLLTQGDVFHRFSLASYLIFACHDLKDPQDQQVFIRLAQNPSIQKSLRDEIQLVAKSWKPSAS